MRHAPHPARHRSRRVITVLTAAAVGSLTVLLPASVLGADSAAAAPAAGFTASLIPTGVESYLIAIDPDTDTVYVPSYSEPELTVIDGSTGTVTARIGLPANPHGIAVDPATDTIYATVAQTTTSPPAVAVIDGTTNTVMTTIALPTESFPADIAVDSSTDTVYVAETGGARFAVIDGSTNSVTTTVSTAGIGTPAGLAVDEATDVIWAGTADGYLLAINGANDTITKTIGVTGPLGALAVDPVTDTVYGALEHGVDVINGATGAISTTIGVTEPLGGLAVDPGSGTVFVSTTYGTGSSGTTWVIDATSNTITDTIERGGVTVVEDTATGVAYEAPFVDQKTDVWVLTPSTANAASPLITSVAATFTVGTASSVTIQATALPAATYSETGTLPAGLTLSSSGILSGTPAAGTTGVYPIAITASNGVAPDYSQAFTLTVNGPPTITVPPSITLTVGENVDMPIQVTGIPSPGFVASNLPLGLGVIPTSTPGEWELTGSAQVGSGGVYDADFSAGNTLGTATATSSITVLEAPDITSATATTFYTNSYNSFAVSANCYPSCTFSEDGTLPSGVTLTSQGVVQGTHSPGIGPGNEGVYPITITASNSQGTVTQDFLLTLMESNAIGYEGTDGQLWVQAPPLGGLGFQSLGGDIIAPPAIAAPPNPNGTTLVAPLFIATGTDKHLWIRSLTAGWQELGPVTATCIGAPAAVITGTASNGFILTVACRGTDNALWANSAVLGGPGLPSFPTAWTNLGGVLSAAPALAPAGGAITFFVRGTDGRIYTRTQSAGYTETSWVCAGQPAAAEQVAPNQTVFVCEGPDHALWDAIYAGDGWLPAASLGGSLIGTPAVAATTGGTELLVEGTNGVIWMRTLTTGWAQYGPAAMGGAGAAGLN